VVYDAASVGTLIEAAQPMRSPRDQVSTICVRVRSRGSAITTIYPGDEQDGHRDQIPAISQPAARTGSGNDPFRSLARP
jgi:hypothetical protein